MKTLDEIHSMIEYLNEEAHSAAWDTWVEADRLEAEGEDEDAEDMREQASMEQAEYFRDSYYQLNPEDQSAVKYWLKNDESFKDDFSCWFGFDEFESEFESTDNK